MYSIAKRNHTVDVQIWIDSKRMTGAQERWLENIVKRYPGNNLRLFDLRSIPEYEANPFFDQPDDPHDADYKHSMIWRQVDTARILVCLQGNHDQVFYSDIDISNLNINSDEIQDKLRKHKVIFG